MTNETISISISHSPRLWVVNYYKSAGDILQLIHYAKTCFSDSLWYTVVKLLLFNFGKPSCGPFRLIKSSTSVGSRLTNLRRGWYDVTSTGICDIVSPETEICLSGFNTGTWLFFSFFIEICIFKEKYADNVVKDTPNFISSRSKIVKCLRRRRYDPVIIERTIGLVLGPCTALYRPLLKHCTLTNKAVGTIWLALS